MIKYYRKPSSQFKRDFKKIQHNKKVILKLEEVLQILESGNKLPDIFRDHNLKGSLTGFRECHIFPDVLLVYNIIENELILYLIRIGSHSEIFG